MLLNSNISLFVHFAGCLVCCVLGPTLVFCQISNSFGLSSAHFDTALLYQGNGSSDPLRSYRDIAVLCGKMNLTIRQNQLCLQGDGIPETLLDATKMAASFCQQEFKYERWNCALDQYRIALLSKVHRETAAMFAFSAAGLQHAISRACSAGRLKKCFCAESKNEIETRQTWKWGGCGDNLAYGRSFTNKFLDTGQTVGEQQQTEENEMIKTKTKKTNFKKKSGNVIAVAPEAGGSSHPRWRRTNGAQGNTLRRKQKLKKKKKSEDLARMLMDRHNNRVGMQVVEDLVRLTCKCHGVSGSCTVQTCWNQLASFGETAAVIKAKYDSAVRSRPTIADNISNSRHLTKLAAAGAPKSSEEAQQMALGDSLFYTEESPDFCTKNPSSPGTSKRVCSKKENCDHLCCGRGFSVRRSVVRSACNCKLVFCCKVECSSCLLEKHTFVCK